jgi:putative transposase
MLVDKLIDKYGLMQQAALQAIGLARSTYCYRSKAAGRALTPLDAEFSQAIREVVKRASVYGYRKVHAVLRARGWCVNHKKVLRYMRHLGLLQPRKVKGRSFTRPALIEPACSNTYWEEDLTYVWCGDCNNYLFALIDGYDKEIPGDHFGDRCRSDEASEVLERAVLKRFGGRVPEGHTLVLRIDRGTQFIARKFRETAKRLNVRLEYAGIQCPDDKPYIEAFFSKYKVEEVYRNEYQNSAEAKTGWELYRSWYETERVHQSLNYQTPKQVWESQNRVLDNKAKMCNINQAPFCPK